MQCITALLYIASQSPALCKCPPRNISCTQIYIAQKFPANLLCALWFHTAQVILKIWEPLTRYILCVFHLQPMYIYDISHTTMHIPKPMYITYYYACQSPWLCTKHFFQLFSAKSCSNSPKCNIGLLVEAHWQGSIQIFQPQLSLDSFLRLHCIPRSPLHWHGVRIAKCTLQRS